MSSSEEYEQQNYWKKLNAYQLAYDIVCGQIENAIREEATKLGICLPKIEDDFEIIEPRDPKSYHEIELLTLEEIMERYPLTVEQVNALKEKQDGK